jgi:hypothetical protein
MDSKLLKLIKKIREYIIFKKLYKKTGEYGKFKELEKLFKKWKKQVSKNKVVWKYNGKKYKGNKYFTEDGFFPNYFNSKIRVLFIAREPREASGKNIIQGDYKKYKEGETGGKFIKRILYLAYGIKHGCKTLFNDIPNHDEIGKEYVETNDFNFAIMEISKYSNDSHVGADIVLMNSFLEHSELKKYNFIQEELSILDPDVIITMNLWDKDLIIIRENIELAFGYPPKVKGGNPLVCIRKIKINNKYVPLLDTYHFSTWAKGFDDKTCFYDPVMEIVSKLDELTEYINSY